MTRAFPTFGLALAALLSSKAGASACSVCFGEKGSQASMASGQSILFLLGIVATVLLSMIAFFVVLARRASRAPLGSEDVLQLIQTPESQARRL